VNSTKDAPRYRQVLIRYLSDTYQILIRYQPSLLFRKSDLLGV